METTSKLVLYQRENCPYCQLVRKKLSQLNLPVKLVPVERDGADRKTLLEVSGQRSVPVLADGETVVIDSEKILGYLSERYGQNRSSPMPANDIGINAIATGNYEDVVERTIEALKSQGFGVQTEIDIQATLKKKLDVDMPRQLILGACNPGIAHRLLEAEPGIGLLLPCNVTIREVGDNRFDITAVHPVKLLAMVGREDLIPIAKEARDRLKTAMKAVNDE
jgi:uncharacterized protein (DUF302 family)/glutaredoxin